MSSRRRISTPTCMRQTLARSCMTAAAAIGPASAADVRTGRTAGQACARSAGQDGHQAPARRNRSRSCATAIA